MLILYHISFWEDVLKNNFIKKRTRRTLLKESFIAGTLLAVTSIVPTFVFAQQGTGSIEHPLKNPKKYTDKGRCPNCGMMLNMWARTRHEFSNSEGEHATCSIRCLADMSQNSGEKPNNIKTALYLHPESMVAAESAFYVLGSSAKGTMTMKSKVAFASEKEAENFVAQYGGKVAPFQAALEVATKELSISRPAIEKKRKKKGKILDPTAETRCVVCGMYPARYPEHRCQLSTGDGNTYHFCSSQCLVTFLAEPKQYVKKELKVKSVWVTVFQEHSYEYAFGLYYLVGSNLMGPMGREALSYRSHAAAEAAAQQHGGKVLRFNDLTPQLVNGT